LKNVAGFGDSLRRESNLRPSSGSAAELLEVQIHRDKVIE
jgi:hypothetical protein